MNTPSRKPNAPQPIIVTDANFERLQRLIEHASDRDSDGLELLDSKLTRAELVSPERIPSNVVTMNSTVLFEDQSTGLQRQLTLVYPNEGSWSAERVSILAPVGIALFGQSAGDVVESAIPGRSRVIRIVSVVHQPETASRQAPPPAA